MEGTDTVQSGADLVASMDPGLFNATDAAPESPESPDSAEAATGEPEAPAEAAPEAAAEPEEQPAEAEETAEAPTEEAAEAKPEDVKPGEELPEGVRRGKDRNGKDGLWLTPQRYETFHAAHKTLQQVSEMLGEPLTPEAVDIRNRAYIAQERMFNDLLSGDPKAQGNLIQYLINEAKNAQQNGEIGDNPMVTFAQQMYSTLRDSDPDAYANLRLQAAKDLVEEMYNEAATQNNRNLWLSAGHIAKSLNLKWRPEVEMADAVSGQSDPLAALRAENERLKAEVTGRQASNSAAQFESWQASTKTAVQTAVRDEAIEPALASEREAWKQYPDAFKDLIEDRLHSAVLKTISQDRAFAERVSLLDAQARRAASAQKRADVAEQIKTLYTNRARLAVEANKPSILKTASALLKERSDATHKRLADAQKMRGPSPSGTTVRKSLIPAGGTSSTGENFNADAEVRRLVAML